MVLPHGSLSTYALDGDSNWYFSGYRFSVYTFCRQFPSLKLSVNKRHLAKYYSHCYHEAWSCKEPRRVGALSKTLKKKKKNICFTRIKTWGAEDKIKREKETDSEELILILGGNTLTVEVLCVMTFTSCLGRRERLATHQRIGLEISGFFKKMVKTLRCFTYKVGFHLKIHFYI